MNKPCRKLMYDLLWILALAVTFIAIVLVSANLGGCGNLPKLGGGGNSPPIPPDGSPDGGVATQPGRGLSVFPWFGAIAMLVGAAMIAAKFWMPVMPVGGAAGLIGVGLFMAFVPTLVAKFWLPFGIMLMIVAGIVAISFVANWLGLRKSGLPIFKRQSQDRTLKQPSTSTPGSSPGGIQNVNDDFSKYLGGN